MTATAATNIFAPVSMKAVETGFTTASWSLPPAASTSELPMLHGLAERDMEETKPSQKESPSSLLDISGINSASSASSADARRVEAAAAMYTKLQSAWARRRRLQEMRIFFGH